MDKQILIDTENRIVELFKQKKIRSMFHLSFNNELQLINIFRNIKPEDWCFSTHRSHFHALLKGMKSNELIERVLKGNSMHLFSKKLNFFTSSIVGGVLPIAVGVALGIKRVGGTNKVWVFVGDACSRMGIFYECVNYSQGHDLPIEFVVEDNGLCINAWTEELWGNAKDKDRVHKYSYERCFPHAGSGDYVTFEDQ